MEQPQASGTKDREKENEAIKEGSAEQTVYDEPQTFMEHDFGLDRRLIKAVAKMCFVYPTLVQSQCIPLALKGKDLLVGSLEYNLTAGVCMHSSQISLSFSELHFCCER